MPSKAANKKQATKNAQKSAKVQKDRHGNMKLVPSSPRAPAPIALTIVGPWGGKAPKHKGERHRKRPQKRSDGLSKAQEVKLLELAAEAEERAEKAERKVKNMAKKAKKKAPAKKRTQKRTAPKRRSAPKAAPKRRSSTRRHAPPPPPKKKGRGKGKGKLSPMASAFLLQLGGAILSGYLSGVKVQTQSGVMTLADAAPKIPKVGFEATVAVVLYAAGWVLKVKWLRMLAVGPGLIAGYKLFRGVAKGLEAGSQGLDEIPASMQAAGLPDAMENGLSL